jgi:hypothetical protein
MKIEHSPNGLSRSNIFISVADKKAFQALARKRGVSYSTLIRQAMSTFLGSKSEPFKFKQFAKK